MNMVLTPEQQMFRRTIKEFADNELAPIAAEIDETSRFPWENIRKMAELGLLGLTVPEEYGGAGGTTMDYVIAMEEVARACAATAAVMAVNNTLACYPIQAFGSEAQKQKYLVPMARGEKLGCYGLTEPGAGSDAASLQTRAERDGDSYVLNGSKMFITNGAEASTAVVYARTDKARSKAAGISAFILERDWPGYVVGKLEHKLGIRASSTAQLHFEELRVPVENRLGEEGFGFKIAMIVLDSGRISIAAQALGIGQAAFEAALRYSKQRQQFGKAIADFQATQWKLADMAVNLDAARLLTYRAASYRDQGIPFTKEASMAKLHASEVAMGVSHQAVQIHGGYGYLKDFPVERFFRDAKITEIYEGTSEVQRLVISSQLLREQA